MEKPDTPYRYKSSTEIAKGNLMQGLIEECNRVRDIITEYKRPELEGAGDGAVFIMKLSIMKAEQAMGISDPIAMLQAFEDLKEYELS